jgi:putative transposase
VRKYSQPESARIEARNKDAELRRLKAELKRMTEERDILKKGRRVLCQSIPGKVRIHTGSRSPALCTANVSGDGSASLGYCAWRSAPITRRQRENQRLRG